MLEQFPADARPEDVIAALEQDGAAVLEGLLLPERVDELVGDFQHHLDAVPWCNTEANDHEEFFGQRTKRLHGLAARSKHFGELIVDARLIALAERFLLPHARDLRLSTGELMALGAGESDQALHRDADSWYHMPRPRPDVLFSANVALTEFRADNGATVVVPGSHRWPPDRQAREEEKVRAAMPRGAALLYSGDVLHGGGSNQTDELRIGLYIGYLVSWLRPIENHSLTSGLDAIQSAPERARRLFDCVDGGFTTIA